MLWSCCSKIQFLRSPIPNSKPEAKPINKPILNWWFGLVFWKYGNKFEINKINNVLAPPFFLGNPAISNHPKTSSYIGWSNIPACVGWSLASVSWVSWSDPPTHKYVYNIYIYIYCIHLRFYIATYRSVCITYIYIYVYIYIYSWIFRALSLSLYIILAQWASTYTHIPYHIWRPASWLRLAAACCINLACQSLDASLPKRLTTNRI